MFTFTSSSDGFLLDIARRFEEAPRHVHEDVCRELEVGLSEALDRQFTTGQDPYGRPYQPPKDDHLPPMVRSGRLRRGLGVRCTSGWGGIRVDVVSEAPYARYLQHGTSRMAPRLIVPGSAVLAAAWREAARAAYTRAFRRWFRH